MTGVSLPISRNNYLPIINQVSAVLAPSLPDENNVAHSFCYGLEVGIEIAIQIPLFQVEKLLLSSDLKHFPIKIIFNIGNCGRKIMLSFISPVNHIFRYSYGKYKSLKFILLQINCDLANTLCTTWLQLLLHAKCRKTDATRDLSWRQTWYSVWYGVKWLCKNHNCTKHCITYLLTYLLHGAKSFLSS